ncbi:hypothetical protein EDD86DRAFT_220725 [Gorgonomyces haynaldii]|nr:hypothetical protein EDD86DRAFT_220725 [Gorgonomyces haynaldii]
MWFLRSRVWRQKYLQKKEFQLVTHLKHTLDPIIDQWMDVLMEKKLHPPHRRKSQVKWQPQRAFAWKLVQRTQHGRKMSDKSFRRAYSHLNTRNPMDRLLLKRILDSRKWTTIEYLVWTRTGDFDLEQALDMLQKTRPNTEMFMNLVKGVGSKHPDDGWHLLQQMHRYSLVPGLRHLDLMFVLYLRHKQYRKGLAVLHIAHEMHPGLVHLYKERWMRVSHYYRKKCPWMPERVSLLFHSIDSHSQAPIMDSVDRRRTGQ